MSTHLFRTAYFDEALTDLATVIERATIDLSEVDCDTLVGSGFSGGVVIPALALALGKHYVLIRKEDDDSHHGRGRLIGVLGERWLFVDDFICTGATRNRVAHKIAEAAERERLETHYVGQYMYENARINDTGLYLADTMETLL